MAELVPIATKENESTATNFDPITATQNEFKKMAKFEAAIKHPLGLSKMAAVLQNPVRKYLDLVPIFRRIAVVEPMAAGQIAYYDADLQEFSGVKIGEDGSSRFIICKALRTVVPPFEIVSLVKVPYRELWWRKYKVLDRSKERLRQALGMKEDLLGFALLHDAATLVNSEVVISSGNLNKDGIAYAFKEIEKHRLVGSALVMSPEGVFGIRTWSRTQVDEVARIEIRQTGQIGNIFGAKLFITNLIRPLASDVCYAYAISSPQFLAWMPMWTQAQVTPADRPDDQLLGFAGYEFLGMMVHNARAVCRIKFNPSTVAGEGLSSS